MNIYVASSWRNALQPDVVFHLRKAGHEVYDFRRPAPGVTGFAWSAIDPHWKDWSPAAFRRALEHPIARRGFMNDLNGILCADLCVLVLPSGRSAHLEAGFCAGAKVPVLVLQTEPCEPELMYLLTYGLVLSLDELLAQVERHSRMRPIKADPRLSVVEPDAATVAGRTA